MLRKATTLSHRQKRQKLAREIRSQYHENPPLACAASCVTMPGRAASPEKLSRRARALRTDDASCDDEAILIAAHERHRQEPSSASTILRPEYGRI